MGISRIGMFPWAHKKYLSQIGRKISRPGPKTFALKRVASHDFCGFWAPKGQIFTNMTPLLLFMINTIILHVIVKFGCARSKIVDFRLKNTYFSVFFCDYLEISFCPDQKYKSELISEVLRCFWMRSSPGSQERSCPVSLCLFFSN